MNKIKLFSLVIGPAIMFFSCGGESTSHNTEMTDEETTAPVETETEAPSPTENVAPEGEVVELSLEGNDQMQFNKNEFRVKAGQTVRLTLIHTGTMPKNAMGHNFVLLDQGVDIPSFGQKAAAAMESDYIPESEKENIIAHTKLLGGGESDTIEFTAPAKGTYEFICSFPGHYALMKGVFIVE